MDLRVEEGRVALVDGAGRLLGEVTFAPAGPGAYCIDHTFVDPSLRGQGAGDRLVAAAAEEISRRGARVTATCSYAAAWLARRQGGSRP